MRRDATYRITPDDIEPDTVIDELLGFAIQRGRELRARAGRGPDSTSPNIDALLRRDLRAVLEDEVEPAQVLDEDHHILDCA